jgi:hypothetical protein
MISPMLQEADGTEELRTVYQEDTRHHSDSPLSGGLASSLGRRIDEQKEGKQYQNAKRVIDKQRNRLFLGVCSLRAAADARLNLAINSPASRLHPATDGDACEDDFSGTARHPRPPVSGQRQPACDASLPHSAPPPMTGPWPSTASHTACSAVENSETNRVVYTEG